MSQDRDDRCAAFAAAELAELAADFADESGRQPSSAELCEVLTWGLRSCRDDVLSDANPSNMQELAPRLRKGAQKRPAWSEPDASAGSAVDALNDQAFGAATTLLTDLSRLWKSESGAAPALDELCRVLTLGLQRSPADLLADVAPADIAAIVPRLARKGKVSTRPGDIVAIPTQAGQHLFAVVVAKNSLGTAYGFFKGAGPLRPIAAQSHPPVFPYPIYTGDQLVAQGKWPIIGHDEGLLALFPPEPEIYHSEQLLDDGPPVGPFGSAETPSGAWRDVSEDEARAVGLTSGQYSQVVLPDYIETYVAGLAWD